MNWELANTATALGVEAWEQLEADFRHQRRFDLAPTVANTSPSTCTSQTFLRLNLLGGASALCHQLSLNAFLCAELSDTASRMGFTASTPAFTSATPISRLRCASPGRGDGPSGLATARSSYLESVAC